MSADETQAGPDELQFDRVDTGADASVVAAPTVTCAVCGKSVGAEYYHVNGKPVCENCRQILIASAVVPRTIGPFLKAGLFGLGAAIAGAAIYYGVIEITKLEIGLVAILIGYMVGYMVRKGSGDRGGRRFQILAVILTYWAVGLAYAPLAFKGMTGSKSDSTATSLTKDSANAPVSADGRRANEAITESAGVGAADGSATGDAKRMSPLVAIAMLFALVFALPVLSIVGSMPSGLISALIIVIGMRQAWTMTAPHVLDMSGPYKVGAGPEPAAG